MDMECATQGHSQLDSAAESMDANAVWDVVSLQDIVTPAQMVNDAWFTTKQGHNRSRSTFSGSPTATMIHSNDIGYGETKHDLRVSSLVLRAKSGL